jgi:hypothetical protein
VGKSDIRSLSGTGREKVLKHLDTVTKNKIKSSFCWFSSNRTITKTGADVPPERMSKKLEKNRILASKIH